MKLGDIYKHKETNDLIQIDSFANHINNIGNGFIIVYTNIKKHNDYETGSCPSFNGYGSEEEIEKEYELLVSQGDLTKYDSWEEILKLAETKNHIVKNKRLEFIKEICKKFELEFRDTGFDYQARNEDIAISIRHHVSFSEDKKNIVQIEMMWCFDKWSKAFYNYDISEKDKIIKDIQLILDNIDIFNLISCNYCCYNKNEDKNFNKWMIECLKDIVDDKEDYYNRRSDKHDK